MTPCQPYIRVPIMYWCHDDNFLEYDVPNTEKFIS